MEVGAGTGICGIVACMVLGCPVILTDRCDHVLDNLRENVRLNGLSERVAVTRLAWGGERDFELPVEIREDELFKVRCSMLFGVRR